MSQQKYRNIPTERDGVTFQSKREAGRYQELIVLQRAGLIRELELQPAYPLIVNAMKIGVYKGDFRYVDCGTGRTITEDVKAPPTRTAVYRLKKKLVYALYRVEIQEV